MTVKPAEYLKRPYGRVVVPESDGTFQAEIIEFPGCIAVGDTAGEALANLERVADSWLQATIAKGLRVPEPIESVDYSGKLVVRLPKTLHKKAAHAAARGRQSQSIYRLLHRRAGGHAFRRASQACSADASHSASGADRCTLTHQEVMSPGQISTYRSGTLLPQHLGRQGPG